MEPLIDRPKWDHGQGREHRELLDALSLALKTYNCRLEHVKWFGAGRSGSPVAGIIRHEDGPDQRILKFCSNQQHQRMRSALLARNTFVEQHLAKVEKERIPLGAEKCAVYMRPAGDNMERLESMEDLRTQGRAIDYGTIVRAVVGEWNEDRPVPVRRSVQSVVGSIVGRRRGPALRWIRAASHVDDFAPVSFLSGEMGRQIVQGLLIGNAHGDLSSRNILLPADPDVRSGGFQLIDYDHFSREAPLARDPMHLLVGLALDDFAAQEAVRQEIIKVIVNPGEPGISSKVDDFSKISAAIHDACAAALSVERGFSRSLREHCLLALVGVALRHVGRERKVDDPEAVKRWCYDLAVAAAHRFGEVHQRYEGPQRLLPDPAESGSSMVNRIFEREALTDRLAYGPHGVMSVQGTQGIGKTKLVEVALNDVAERHGDGVLRTSRHHATASRRLDLWTLVELISDEREPTEQGSLLVLLETVLRELKDEPVVVTIAEAENLLEPGTHQVADPELADAFDMLSAEPDHAVSVVLETRHRAVLPVAKFWPDDDTVVLPGMEKGDFLDMLREMHPGMSRQLENLSEAERTTLWRSAGGNPRAAELVCASVCEHPVMTLPELVFGLSKNRKRPAAYLIRLLLGAMPPGSVQMQTMRALAALREPVPADEVAELVGPVGSLSAVRQWLDNLAGRRVIGQQGELFFLSPGDAALVIKTIPVPERPNFFYDAAEVLAAYRDTMPVPRRVDDLRYHLAEVDCLIDAGQYSSACVAMADIDEHLRKWNCSTLLLCQRKRIRGKLDTSREEQHNEDALGGIYVALGKLDRAGNAYDRALKLAGPDAPPMVLSRLYANIAVMHWAAGNIDLAQGYNQYALEKATEAGDRAAMMASLIGLADCHRRRGEFNAAIGRAGKAVDISGSSDPAEASKDTRTLAVTAAVRLSRWHAEQNNLDEAGRWLTTIDEFDGSDADWHRATYLDALADLRLAEGLVVGSVEKVDEAMTAAREAVALAYRVRDPTILLQSRVTLCMAHLFGNRYPDAAQQIRRCLRYRPQSRHLIIPALLALTSRLAGDHKRAAKNFDDLLAESGKRIERDTDGPSDFGARHFHGFAICGLVVDGRGDLQAARRSLSVADLPSRPHAPGLVTRLAFLLQILDGSGPEPGLLEPAIDALVGV